MQIVLNNFVVKNLIFWSDVGYDSSPNEQPDHVEGLEEVQDDTDLLRYVLQPGEVSGPWAEGPLRYTEGDRRGRKRGTNYLPPPPPQKNIYILQW